MKALWGVAFCLLISAAACSPPPVAMTPPPMWSAGTPDADPLDVAVWAEDGISAKDIPIWRRLGATAGDAQFWTNQGVNPDQLIPYASQGISASNHAAMQAAMHPSASQIQAATAAENGGLGPVIRHVERHTPTEDVSETYFAAPSDGYYTSTDGSRVHRPTRDPNPAYGQETAICEDGTHSYSHHHQGTCSHHGGVEQWEN
jgi:hypothetical protein